MNFGKLPSPKVKPFFDSGSVLAISSALVAVCGGCSGCGRALLLPVKGHHLDGGGGGGGRGGGDRSRVLGGGSGAGSASEGRPQAKGAENETFMFHIEISF
jgi:hypothetical protein